MNTAVLQTQLELPYRRETWQTLLPQILPGVEIFRQPTDYPLTTDAQRNMATGLRQLGRAVLADGLGNERIVAIFEVDAAPNVQLSRNRVALRQLVARCIDEVSSHAVLAFFVQPGTHTYRMTYAARESVLGEDLKVEMQETAPKRYTYELGPHTPCRTAAQRLAGLAGVRDKAALKDVTDAFSVEKLNTEFFTIYKQHYQAFCEHLFASDAPTKVFGLKLKGLKDKALDKELKPVRDFAKKLLGRLVFLHFLQKKGWLGCPEKGKDWTGGDPQFLRALYAAANNKDRFHSRCLTPLFFDTLNNPNRPGDVFRLSATDSTLPPCRIPYLNGGLFERDFDAVDKIDFPATLFDALLDFFGQYNFTIDENDPDDHEIGIDPEMLGHIFENLLEDNKDKGAYYTPKAIVQYMCQQSLIHYLQGHFPDDPAAKPEIEQLIRQKEPIDAKDAKNWLTTHAHDLEKLLDDVKICDPAIGSGAFPIGLLQEIYWTKLTLHPGLDRAKAKRDIIQNSIHGVDIDLGAVEIARLRFWLSLIVDEDEPRPLPNLDFKIMQGDSLLESFEGIPLDKLHEPDVRKLTVVGEQHEFYMGDLPTKTIMATVDDRREIGDLIRNYFDESNPIRKAEIHKQIDRFVRDHIDFNIRLTKDQLEIQLQQHHTEIARKRKLASKWTPPAQLEKRLATLKAEIKACDERAAKLRELESKPERPYFLWHLFFQDVFERGGFDIVIANPPYVRMELFKHLKPELRRCYEHVHAERADLYCYFYARAIQHLRERGVLCFISSNKFFRGGYGEKLRSFLTTNTELLSIIDFGDLPIFEATTYPCIVLTKKGEPEAGHIIETRKVDRAEDIARFPELPTVLLQQENFAWRLESPAVLSLLEKIRAAGCPLADLAGAGIYRGIVSGLNEAFLIDGATRSRLVEKSPRAKDVIKPYLGGKNARKWACDYPDLWMIYLPHGVDVSGLDSVLAHLRPLRPKLEARATQQAWYELQQPQEKFVPIYEAPKIVFPDIAADVRFALDERGAFFSNTAYCIASSDLFLLAILNSSVTSFFYCHLSAQFRGGYLRFWTQYVEQIPIPAANDDQKAKLRELARKAGDAAGSELTAIEAEIDQIVFRLFKLDRDEIALIEESANPPKQPLDNKTALLTRVLPELMEAKPYFSTDTVKNRLSNLSIDLDEGTLRHYMSEAMAKGVVHDAGRGWYSRIEVPCTLDPKPVAKLVKLLEKEFPLLDFTCWSTRQINPWMHHILAKFLTFVNVDKDGLSAVADFLRGAGYETHANPGADRADEVRPGDRAVVIRPLLTTAPHDSHFAPPEAVLVDLCVETRSLTLMGPGEFKDMARALAVSSRIPMGALLQYAGKRELTAPDLFGENYSLMEEV